jgi:hypothetical protein
VVAAAALVMVIFIAIRASFIFSRIDKMAMRELSDINSAPTASIRYRMLFRLFCRPGDVAF